MDYGEKREKPIESAENASAEANSATLEGYTPEVDHRAIGESAIFSSHNQAPNQAPDIEFLPTDPAELADYTGQARAGASQAPQTLQPPQAAPQLLFDPSSIHPSGDDISKDTMRAVREMISETKTHPVAEFANYQTMRRLYNEQDSKHPGYASYIRGGKGL